MTRLARSPILDALVAMGVVAVCVLVLGILRVAEPGPADRTLAVHGAFDGCGHMLTALVAWVGVRALRLPIPGWSVLVGGIVLDAGHIPNLLEFTQPVSGPSRNGSHSLAAVVFLAMIGFLDRRHANLWLGIAIGAAAHLGRDLGTGTLPLLWPVTESVFGTSWVRYLAGLGVITTAMIGSGALLQVYAVATACRSAP